ncbi:protein Wnt-7b-like isoform X3 [Stylophora pistillata]|uniref:protein Wnt-7b-like isoform X3 n=1 Tax=Stylophora pistillata TaxID=50429 RepID=UPI000C04EE90|nr:protein Wnt-7b-like isoform X3 [Stylophora pistillata]
MESQHGLALFTLLLATIFAYMQANSKLLFVSSVATLVPSLICTRIPGLSNRQRNVCDENPKVIYCIREGYRMAAEECRFQFRKSRWNCTLLGETSDFDDKAIKGTREMAYTQAIISAGVVYTVTRACSMGNLSECNCDKKLTGMEKKKHYKGWTWGGCSVDLSFGLDLSSRFVNAREEKHNAFWLMNRHNSRAGRQALKDSLKMHCRCHGTSGSCVSRTCWQDLPGFKKIGSQLKQRYLKASRVKTIKYPSPSGKRDAYLWLEFGDNKPPSRDLVYLENSPNYCDRDRRRKIPGTIERECNKTSDGTDGCELMCCGRGYNTHEIVKKWRCNCKFHWCCYVKCENCKERMEVFRCK